MLDSRGTIKPGVAKVAQLAEHSPCIMGHVKKSNIGLLHQIGRGRRIAAIAKGCKPFDFGLRQFESDRPQELPEGRSLLRKGSGAFFHS